MEMNEGNRNGGSLGCVSQPASPRLTGRGRLGRVGKILSRSDANLVKSSRKRSVSEESQDESVFCPTPEVAPSPSKGSSSIISKASGLVSHLRARFSKHKSSKSLRECHSPQQTPRTEKFSPCCGHKRELDSVDTLVGLGGTCSDSMGSQSLILRGVSLSGDDNENITSSERGEIVDDTDHDDEDRLLVESDLQGTHSVKLQSSQLRRKSSGPKFSSIDASDGVTKKITEVADSTVHPHSSSVQQAIVPSKYPFHTLSVHLQKGRNLVARDTCGSSDPYVKVKVGDKLHYKSKTIYKDLNPVWDESFVLPISDLRQPVLFKVFDYDWGFQDDFMGLSTLDVSTLVPNKATDLSLTLTEHNLPGDPPMGQIFLACTLVPRTLEEKDIWFGEGQGRLADTQRRLKSQIWSSVLTVLLLEATHLSSYKEKSLMDVFVKFRLGNQKYKSRTVARTKNPKWIEQFDFYLYEGQPQILEMQIFDESQTKDFIGRCCLDVGLLEKELTHHKSINLEDCEGEISMLLTISGTAGVESISDLMQYNPTLEDNLASYSQYWLRRSFHNLKDVGHLTVKVYEASGLAAADIGGKSDPFCVLELVNARLQTQTEYKTLNPTWNKIFTFSVKDITDILEITVYDEDKNHKQEFLGKLNIPLWKIKNGDRCWYTLKDRKLTRPARGSDPQILLEMHLIYNAVRAGLRVMDPPEQKFLQPDQRLKKEVFLLNLERLKKIGVSVYDIMQYVQSCMEWEYPLRSILALIIYQVFVYTFQPFMVPLILMILMLRNWLSHSLRGTPLPDDIPEDETIVLDVDEEDQEDEKKMSLRQKLQAVQDATQLVQNTLGDIASICESTKNTFRMVMPFISWLAVLGLVVVTILLYFIPVRYLVMAYGFHKFLRPLLRPNMIPTNELYNMIIRVPDNQQLIHYRQVRGASSPEKQKTKSPPEQRKKKHKFW